MAEAAIRCELGKNGGHHTIFGNRPSFVFRRKPLKTRDFQARPAGLEPATCGLETYIRKANQQGRFATQTIMLQRVTRRSRERRGLRQSEDQCKSWNSCAHQFDHHTLSEGNVHRRHPSLSKIRTLAVYTSVVIVLISNLFDSTSRLTRQPQ
jgi:hypothetical protein